jgi:hypothetical protein
MTTDLDQVIEQPTVIAELSEEILASQPEDLGASYQPLRDSDTELDDGDQEEDLAHHKRSLVTHDGVLWQQVQLQQDLNTNLSMSEGLHGMGSYEMDGLTHVP